MPHNNNAISPTSSAIAVGQLVYTSFQEFGFRMLMSPETPPYIQKFFVDKIVNARWDPHSPPSQDFRAGYVYQISGKEEHTVFGWLYYDGQDDFGRSGVPYFLAYYRLGHPSLDQLQIFFDCIEKGPAQSISRQIQDQTRLQSLMIDANLDYEPARLGVVIPSDIKMESLKAFEEKQRLDWFVTQNAPVLPTDDSEVGQESAHGMSVSEVSRDQPSEAIQLVKSQMQSDSALLFERSQAKARHVEAILQEFVNKTMGIQGVALVSEEGHPIVSAIGIDESTLGLIAGSMLYTTQVAHQELSWSTCELVTLRGPDNYLMLSFFQPSVYLLIKSAKVPMGLLEGVVKRMSNRLKTEIGDVIAELVTVGSEPQPEGTSTSDTAIAENPKLLSADLDVPPTIIPDEDEIDFDEDITYRGRPTSS